MARLWLLLLLLTRLRDFSDVEFSLFYRIWNSKHAIIKESLEKFGAFFSV